MPDLAFAKKQLRSLIDRASLERGYQYALDGRARITRERRDGLEIEIEASCRGSRPEPYVQQVLLGFDEGGALDLVEGECTCPMETDCKHVACAALVWLARNGASAAPARAEPEALRAPRPVYLDEELAAWLAQFERALKRGTNDRPASAEVLCYSLSEDARVLEVAKGRPLKDGRLVELRPLSLDLQSYRNGRAPPRYVTSADLPVFECLLRMPLSDDYSGWQLRGSLGASAVEAALATGRLRREPGESWRTYGARRTELSLGGDGWLKRGPGLNAELVLRTEATGRMRWAARCIDSARDAIVPIAVSPPWYLDRGRGETGWLEIAGDRAIATQLLGMPEIERESAPVFLSTLRNIAAEAGIAELAARIPPEMTIPACPPIARLRVVKGVFRHFDRRRRDEAQWIAELWFAYGEELMVPDDLHAAPGLAWRDAAGVERIALRDLAGEKVLRQKLAVAGCRFRGARGSWQGYRVDAERAYFAPGQGSENEWAAALGDFLQMTAAAGAEVEFAKDFPHRVQEAGELYAEFGAAESPGWFDLDLGVVIDGKRVSLADPLAGWIERQRDLAAWLEAEHGEATVLLGVKAFGMLRVPAERLKRLLAPLIDTFGFERRAAGGKLRLSRIELALLPEIPATGPGAAAHVARLRERLADFRGIHPAPPAAGFRGQLRPYQQAGLDWLQFLREFELAGILADDMGLGKTVQALAHLDLEKAAGRADRPSLVVAPTSVLPNWREEAARFAPRLKVLTLHGAGRAVQHSRIADADLVLTSYPLLARDRDALVKQDYHLVLFDEAQFLKNAKTQVHAAAAALHARHRLALTGTPIENNLAELWAHFNLLLPGFLGDARQFARVWRAPIEKEGDRERMARLAKRVRPFILRRTRAEVLDELPEKTEIVQHIEIEGAQRDLYESLRIALDGKLRRAIAAKGIAGTQIEILDALLKLRQACCDPRLVKAPAAKAAHGESAKLEALREMLAELRAEGRRALLFSQFTSMLDLIEAELAPLGLRHVRLSGDTVDRETPVRAFQSGDADLFLISLRAGGTGLNLTAADTVIHYDPWWNPAVEAQATARAHRIGQDKAVFVFKLIALGTVEERILELVKRKEALADALLGEGRARGPLITEDDIKTLLAPIDAR